MWENRENIGFPILMNSDDAFASHKLGTGHKEGKI